MPELPEVETIKRVIEPQIQGLVIKNIQVNREEVIAYPTAEEFISRLVGQQIAGMDRRGKFLIFIMESGDRVILHLRMTGGLLLTPPDFPGEKHTHVIFCLNSHQELRFADTRRFGRFWLIKCDEEDTYSGIAKLGKEPFDAELSAKYLIDHWGRRKKTIKECLLEQTVVTGIGNIYSDEILFKAGIYPARPANTLTGSEWERLAALIPERLHYFIEKNEITAEEYLETKGKDYRNTPFLQIYGHAKEPCPVCKQPLCRMVVGGRSSTYCPACQRETR